MAQPKLQRMTIDEFLDWQARQDRNYELVDGYPVLPLKMMTGATRRHDGVTVRCLSLLDQQLRGKPCQPRTDDVATRIPRGNLRRPDITVDCGTDGRDRDTVSSGPRVVIEVLSPSTVNFDRVQKLDEYKSVPSIQVIILFDTEQPRAAVHRRRGEHWWEATNVDGLDSVIELPEIEARLPLAEVYERLTFEPLG